MDIVIPDFEQKLIDKKRTSLTVRLSALEASALAQIFWKSEIRGNSFSAILRTALHEYFVTHFNLNLPDFKSVNE